MKRVILLMIFAIFANAEVLKIDILYLEKIIKKPPALSNIIEEPKDSALKGLELAIKDSNKAARFLNQEYVLHKSISKDEQSLVKSFEEFVSSGGGYVVLNVDDSLLSKLLENPNSKKALLINSTNSSTKFRKEVCNKNLLHTIASDAMLYDGLVQFLVKRDWRDILLLKGSTIEDKKVEEAIKRAVKRYGAKIVDEKVWRYDSDIRRRAQSEMPSFTQSKEHDVVLVSDFYKDFGEYVYFNTWLPRPVAGSVGLTPVTWHKVIEAWGAAQLQKRFEKFSSRWMNSKDFSSWVALRVIVTAIGATKTVDVKKNIEYIYSKEFELAAYKGRKLTFREYNGQLRLPVSLVHPKALVSTSPQIGFLHPVTDLDTLGIAPHELECK